MSRLSTVILEHTKTKRRIIINEIEWAQDLGRGRYRDFKRVGERQGEKSDALIVEEAAQEALKEVAAEQAVDNEPASGQSADSVEETLASLERKSTPKRRRRRTAKEDS